MTITLLGYIVLPLGMILLLLSNDEYLLQMVFWTSGMTGSSVLSFGDTEIQPSYYLAFLWMIREFILVIKRREYNIKKYLSSFMTFVVIAVISTVMPLFLSGKVTTMNVDGDIEILRWSVSNITQTIYLIFCFAFTTLLCNKINGENYDRYFKSYIQSLIIVYIITLYQIVAYRYDILFDPLFRTGLHIRYTSTLFWDKRLSGPCLEASMLAYYLIAALPIVVRSSNKFVKYGLGFGFLILGIISVSSTFFVGIVVWLLLEGICVLVKYKGKVRCKKSTVLGILSAIFIMFLVITITGNLQNIMNGISTIVDQFCIKLRRQNDSGVERSETFYLLLKNFEISPVIGIGFGSSRGKDLFSTWLANTGLLGMGAIFVFVATAFKKSYNNQGLQISIILIWFCMCVSVAEPYNLFIWILMSFALNVDNHRIYMESKNEKSNN